MRAFSRILWLITFLAALLAGPLLVLLEMNANGAPQEAAAAAMACAMVIIPYVLARAVTELGPAPVVHTLPAVPATPSIPADGATQSRAA